MDLKFNRIIMHRSAAVKAIAFARHPGGGVAFIFAILFPIVMGAVGFGVDYATWLVRKQQLQAIADATALAVVSDMQVSGFDRNRAQAVAEGQVRSLAADKLGGDPIAVTTEPVRRRPVAKPDDPYTVAPANERDQPPTGVRVILSQRKRAIMTKFVTPYLTDIAVRAAAEIVGTSRVCVVALDGSSAAAIDLRDRARISASNCSVYAVSASAAAIDARDASQLSALKSCAVGGYAGSSLRYRPVPITGCPAIKDPLAERASPPVGGCRYTDKVIGNWSETLDPGTYCGGLILTSGAVVRLNPGIYVIKDGPLVVGTDSAHPLAGPGQVHPHDVAQCHCYHNGVSQADKHHMHCPNVPVRLPPASLSGDGVGFYFTGTVQAEYDGIARPMQFMPRSNVSLSAPTDGAMAGLLFFEERGAPTGRSFEVLSDDARRLVGTIYMPRGTFLVAANQTVADRSEYTAIVAQKLALSQEPRLVLNANYNATKVPVPQGLGQTSARPTLTQ
ncbi:TadE/TadG family type IV pilus assembly protein [Methylobacterium aquaticum]|uniref:TadE/TadG family type IV pilus assembly protein n=1 Tax=Methylobacterium aquaticum TaxID=270351 RepID=UPI001931CEB0|nr:TadE/TadG family type IV pilus assembly protein [Methylobacterium aquaticum]